MIYATAAPWSGGGAYPFRPKEPGGKGLIPHPAGGVAPWRCSRPPGGGARGAWGESPGRAAANTAGVTSGLVWGIRDTAGARVTVDLDTAALAGISGGNFAQRLRLVALPGCVLS